jgi:predicted small lipoprotein YifL
MKKRSTPCAAIVVALTAALAACATTTPVASPPAEVSAGQAAAATTTAVQLEPTPAGFRRVVRDGEEYFFQTRAVTGSRARAVEVCMTRDEIRRMEEINEEYRRNAANAGSQSTMKLDSPQ